MIVSTVDSRFNELIASIEHLEDLDSAWNWSSFGEGFGFAASVAAGIAVGVVIT